MTCPSCGVEAQPGQRFCGQCGTALARGCPSCGATNPPGHRFCGSCGATLGDETPASPEPVSERRLVSVLFADLVGFTTLSQHRDPEEVRELLSGYFDRCRTLIERYGGTVEKFIGDAVMAVWGTPVAREDDPERAVRAALTLTQAVTALGEQVGMPELQVRAAVLTGSAAVEVGARGEGMVAGDIVNTASRLQSIAAPGTVLVDEVTRRASEAAIAYEESGTHELKGRDQPVRAFAALRVVAGAGGARRGAGVEAPLVGRDRELQAIIDAGEESAGERRARHLTIVGDAGSGKSRLLWEYYKYLDGISDERWWHQGRCLAYGEGVAYWALAEMVRVRARILEDDAPDVAREKLHAAVEAIVPDERERRLVEPRVAHLLRLEERPDADRADLFSGWRLFFERMAATNPLVLAFEDMQWADSGLLDFIDYLLDWSAEHPIFVLTLGRPELRDRRPAWQPLALEPLDPLAIRALLERIAPGLPDDLVADIARRSEGIPLYAVETIRMLQDRGILVPDGARYVVQGDVSDLDVPETLHALVASRLDGLSASERSLLQDASVLGQSFTAAGAAAISGRPESEVAPLLDGLVAKQVLALDDDPRSPERGSYVFLQALLRTVAYGTLSRRARKARHVAAAQHLEQTWPGDVYDIAEVLASHYLEAIGADPDADDVASLRASARDTLTAAGRAAALLALGPEADRYYEQAAELADSDGERAELFQQAGRALFSSGDGERGEARLRESIRLYERAGIAGSSAAVMLASVLRWLGRIDEASALLEQVRADPGVDPIVRAEALSWLAASMSQAGEVEGVDAIFEEAVETLELEQAWRPLAEALISRAVFRIYRHRLQEGIALLRHALTLAQEHDLPAVALRARHNLTAVAIENDRLADAVAEGEAGVAAARERGDRFWERELLSELLGALELVGRWDEAEPLAEGLMREQSEPIKLWGATFLAPIAAARGDDAALERCRGLAAGLIDASYVDMRVAAKLVLAFEAMERGAVDDVLQLARPLLETQATAAEFRTEAYDLCIRAALAGGNEAAMDDLTAFVDGLRPARTTPLLRAGRARLAAERAHRRGDDQAARVLEDEALALLRSVGARPRLAGALAERAARSDDPQALEEARAIYTELGATRRLAELDRRSEVAAY